MIKSEMDKWMVMTERVKREGEKSDSYCNCQQNVFGLVMNWLLWYQHSLKKTKYAHHKQPQILSDMSRICVCPLKLLQNSRLRKIHSCLLANFSKDEFNLLLYCRKGVTAFRAHLPV